MIACLLFSVASFSAPTAKVMATPETEVLQSNQTSEDLTDLFLARDYSIGAPLVTVQNNQVKIQFTSKELARITYTTTHETFAIQKLTTEHKLILRDFINGENYLTIAEINSEGKKTELRLLITLSGLTPKKSEHKTVQARLKVLASLRDIKRAGTD
ncbi:hypothetical protein [Listeria kieliensis]|uniref:Uncharacterized protein n=1 Tax=Listeria kieliensis TaxID=1621700 RepID=A0A3D8TTN2_9LIST|nr:hypothetical protein [Listeria kieliensis]RDX02159.1 hypothetical protein UR08_01075 [Listeria kieliensis]